MADIFQDFTMPDDFEFQDKFDAQSIWKLKQDCGINPNRYREYIDVAHQREEIERAREEGFRRAVERTEREIEERIVAQRDRELYQHDIFESMKKAADAMSKKQLTVERLAVKFCFISSRINVVQTLVATGLVNKSLTKLNSQKILADIFKSIKREAGLSGISVNEITSAIIKMSAEIPEAEIANKFVNSFFGLVAFKLFKTNPSIIKDIKPVEVKKNSTIRPRNFGGAHNFTTEEIMEMLQEIQTETRNRRNDIIVHDYPNYITHFRDNDNLGSSGSLSDLLKKFTRNL